MPSACQYCGSPLNSGLSFCVVCGRQTQAIESNKMGSIQKPIRNIESSKRPAGKPGASSLRFQRSRRNYETELAVRSFFVNGVPLIVFLGMAIFGVKFYKDPHFARQVTKQVNSTFTQMGGKKDLLPVKAAKPAEQEYVAADPKQEASEQSNKNTPEVGQKDKSSSKRKVKRRWWRRIQRGQSQAKAGH